MPGAITIRTIRKDSRYSVEVSEIKSIGTSVWADEEGTGWAWTVTFGRGKGKRISKIILGSKNNYGKSRA